MTFNGSPVGSNIVIQEYEKIFLVVDEDSKTWNKGIYMKAHNNVKKAQPTQTIDPRWGKIDILNIPSLGNDYVFRTSTYFPKITLFEEQVRA